MLWSFVLSNCFECCTYIHCFLFLFFKAYEGYENVYRIICPNHNSGGLQQDLSQAGWTTHNSHCVLQWLGVACLTLDWSTPDRRFVYKPGKFLNNYCRDQAAMIPKLNSYGKSKIHNLVYKGGDTASHILEEVSADHRQRYLSELLTCYLCYGVSYF